MNFTAAQLNSDALSGELDCAALKAELIEHGVLRAILEERPHLFANSAVNVAPQQVAQIQGVIASVELVVNSPQWLQSESSTSCKGVFFGYDFHVNEHGAHLIEINTNAGGAFLNDLLVRSQLDTSLSGKVWAEQNLEQIFIAMFRKEWQLERGDVPLQSIAIVDEQPQNQYLYPEFLLAQQMFERAEIRCLIANPHELEVRSEMLYCGDRKIDLVYNRLTDFSLAAFPELLDAYITRKMVMTPHPQAYKRYADKRNLVKLTDANYLSTLGVSQECIATLQAGIPQAKLVNIEDAEQWWVTRKQWFFKPVSGYGSKGTYRGDKLTRRVFEEILQGGYIAQRLAVPGERMAMVDGVAQSLKYDVRCYVYDGMIQFVAARLYQGQTTNFRTAGGGFAPVRVVE